MKGFGGVAVTLVVALILAVVLPSRGDTALEFRDEFVDDSKVASSSGVVIGTFTATLPPSVLERKGVVLPRGAGSDFDASSAVAGAVVYDAGLYRMWYGACCASGMSSIGYATSTDTLAWTKMGSVVTASLSAESAGLGYVEVIKVAATYRMWYSGYDGVYTRILAATSADGVSWTKQGVVLDVGASGSADDQFVWWPSVVFDGSMYRLWYTGNSFANQAYKVFYATSPDGLNWTKSGIVIPLGWQSPWDTTHAAETSVRLVDGRYEMLYMGNDGGGERILAASSTDAVTWERRGLFLDRTPTEARVSGPALIVAANGSWLLYYSTDSPNWQGHLAVLPARTGWIRSVPVANRTHASWAFFNQTVVAPIGTSVRVTVRDALTLAALPGLENRTAGAINLSAVDSAVHPSLVFDAWLHGSPQRTPSIDAWEVTSRALPSPPPRAAEFPVVLFLLAIIVTAIITALIVFVARRRRPPEAPK